MKNANKPLSVRIEDDQLVISIGVATLAHAAKHSPEGWHGEITDEAGFARDVLDELNAEEENGDTPVSVMLDDCARRAAENGSEHVS